MDGGGNLALQRSRHFVVAIRVGQADKPGSKSSSELSTMSGGPSDSESVAISTSAIAFRWSVSAGTSSCNQARTPCLESRSLAIPLAAVGTFGKQCLTASFVKRVERQSVYGGACA